MNKNENRDLIYIQRIEKHYSELLENFQHIHNLDEFVQESVYVKAVLFDFVQIAELFNSTSELVKSHFNKNDITGIVTTRNVAVHRYYRLKMDLTYNSIKNELPQVVKTLSTLKDDLYKELIQQVCHKEVMVYVDKIKINANKTISVGYITNFINKEGKYQPACVIDKNIDTLYYQGKVMGYLLDSNDNAVLLISNGKVEDVKKELKDIKNNSFTKVVI